MSLCGTNDEKLKIELLSQWKLEAEFRNLFLEANVGSWKMGKLGRGNQIYDTLQMLPSSTFNETY